MWTPHERFALAALSVAGPENKGTRQWRDSVKEWAGSRKKSISKLRESVAHADVLHITAITREGWWEPLVLLDSCGEETSKRAGRNSLNREEFFSDATRLLTYASCSLLKEKAGCTKPRR